MKPLSSFFILLTSATLCAQTAPNPKPAEETLPEIVVTADKETGIKAAEPASVTRMKEPVLDSARSVQIVTQKVIEDRAIVRPEEAVQNVSGVQRSAYNTGVGEAYLVRGYLQQNFIKDGFRAGSSTGGNTLSAAPPTDVANLESIEVLKGPTALEFGRGEAGGIVNYATRDASFEDSFSIQQQIGSFDFYRTQLNANWAAVPDKFAIRFDAGYEQGDSYIDFMESERIFLSTAFQWKISDQTTLTFKGEYNHDDRITTPGLPYLNGGVLNGIDHDLFMGETDFTNLLTEGYRGLLKLEHRWNDEHKTTLSFHGMESKQDGGYFILANLFGPLQDAAGNIARSAAGADFQEQNFTARLDHLYSATISDSLKNDLLVSVEFDFQRNDNNRSLSGHSSINPYNPVYGGFNPNPLAPFPGFPLFVGESTYTNSEAWSVLLMDRINISDNVFLNFGARVEWFDATRTSTYTSPPFPNSAGDIEEVYFNPSAGIVVKPIPSLSLYASYAQSTFSLQNINRVTSSGGSIDPEKARQLEIGAKKEFFDGRLLASAAFFQINKTDVAATDPANPLFSVNAGEERSRGFEFDLIGQPIPGWNILVNYAYIDTRVIDDPSGAMTGHRRYGVPENSGGIFTTYEVQGGKLKGLGFGGGVTFSDRVAVDTANTGTLPGWAQTDALVYYKHGKARYQLNVKNLFDNEFYFAQGQGTMVNAAPSRMIIASVRLDF